jgi:Fe-S-cluster containining protein
LSCAACCFSTLDTYVRVDGDDYERMGDGAESLTQFVGNRCFMRMTDGHCAALQMSAEGPRTCAIYERRPEVCRALERGSPACEAELLQKRQRPELLRLTLFSEH